MAKKILFILLLPVFCVSFLSGQNSKFEPEWNVGVGFGPTFSSIDFMSGGRKAINTKSKQQFHGGIAIRYLSEKNLGVIAELNYSQQGWEEDFDKNSDNNTENKGYAHTHQLNYLELPVLTHIYFGRKVRFFVNLGPKLSFLMSDSETISNELATLLTSGEASANMTTHQYYRMAERKIDYGLMGGLGLEFRTGIGNFSLEGRYTFGLGDIYNNSKADHFSRSANRVISARLTYYVKLF
ncbi:MAG: porin family protein [Dysgonomonas sp.]|nr:porin family protein [Dysgonomonas sp.]